MGGTSLRSVFWFDPTGSVCSKVATSSMSSFGLTLREASAVTSPLPRCRSFSLTLREASALWALIPRDRSFALTPREASAVRPLFPRCRSFDLTVREAQKVVCHLRRALCQHCWFGVGEISLFPLSSFLIYTGKIGLNLDARFSATCSRKETT